MTPYEVREEWFEGAEQPLHRSAVMNDEILVSAQGDAQGRSWVIGWPVAPRSQWRDIVRATALSQTQRCFAVFGREFVPVSGGRALAGSEVANGFERLLAQRHEESPTLFVIDSDDHQFEIIFVPGSTVAATVTALLKTGEPHALNAIVRAFHPNTLIGNDRNGAVTRMVLARLCEASGGASGGEEDSGVWRRHLPAGRSV